MKKRLIRTLQGILTFTIIIATDAPIAFIAINLGLSYLHDNNIKSMLFITLIAAITMVAAVFMWTCLLMPRRNKKRR